MTTSISPIPEAMLKGIENTRTAIYEDFGKIEKIESDDQYNEVAEVLPTLRKTLKLLGQRYTELYGEFDEALKGKKQQFKALAEPFTQLDERLTNMMNAWNRAKSIKQADDERKRREEEARLEREARAGSQEAAKQIVEQKPVVVEKKRVVSATGTVGTRKQWTFDVLDLSKVPVEYLMIDKVKVNGAIKTGVREIPGINIFETDNLNVRQAS